MRLIAVALLCAFALGAAGAAAREGNECIVAAGTVAPDFGLPHVAQAIAKKKLGVAVIGSASSELTGPAGTNIAYPTWLQESLHSLLPGVAVKVTTYARARETAAEMEAKLARIISESAPALVIWQTGTADAIRGVDPEEFRVALDEGVDQLRAAEADVVFMNMQYSPRTEAMLAVTAYADAMRFVALKREAVLFDRFSIMRRWNESGVFDLYGATRTTNVAERVHDCLGRLLADVVVSGARLAPIAGKGTD
jgi:GDSL-like lipase/acylhydrolase family protein